MGVQGKKGALGGCYSLLITPFEEDGRVDYFAFEKLLEQQKLAGAFGVAVGFDRAEGSALREEEFGALVGQASLAFGDGVVAACGGLSCKDAENRAKRGYDMGAGALFCPPPAGRFSGEAGYFCHLRALSRVVPLPLILARTGGKSGLALCAEQLTVEGVCGVAELGNSLAESGILQKKIGEVPLFCTKDDLLFPSLATGFSGAFSLLSCLYPRALLQLFSAVERGRWEGALALWQALLPLCAFTEGTKGAAFLKWMLHRRGLCTPTVRLPLTIPSSGSLCAFEKACARFEREWALMEVGGRPCF